MYSGVPQGGCLSPTLFTFYTHDVPRAGGQNCNIIYADDITQIVRYPGKSQQMLLKTTEKEIEKINKFESQWKIRTNKSKFKIVPIEGRRTKKVKINNEEIEYNREATSLGLKITTSGFTTHVSDRVKAASTQLRNLARVINLDQKHKRTLYLSTIRTIITYPPIPLHIVSNMQQNKLQIVQNKAARLVTSTRRIEGKTNIEVGRKANLESVKEFLERRAGSIWERMELDEEDVSKLDIFGREKEKYPSSRRRAGRQ